MASWCSSPFLFDWFKRSGANMELESIRAYDAREHLAFNGRRIKEGLP